MANNDPYGGGYQGYAGQSYAGYGSDINSIRNLGMLSDSVIVPSAARPRLSGTS
jgi:hypothetical protein